MADPCRICGWAGGGALDPPLVYSMVNGQFLGWIDTVGKLALPIPPPPPPKFEASLRPCTQHIAGIQSIVLLSIKVKVSSPEDRRDNAHARRDKRDQMCVVESPIIYLMRLFS